MAGIQQAVSSLATGLAYARKVRDYGKMQEANVKVQEQRLALQKQKLALAKKKEANKAKALENREYQLKTERKKVNAQIRSKKEEDGIQVSIGGKKMDIERLSSDMRNDIQKRLKGGNK